MIKIVNVVRGVFMFSAMVEFGSSCQTGQSHAGTGSSTLTDTIPVEASLLWFREPDGYHIDFEKCLDNKRDLYLSDIAEGIEYVALETTPLYIIGEDNVHVVPHGDWLFISEHGKPVGMFDRRGKFIRTIGSIGRGPDEYNHDYRFWHDPSRDILWVWNAFKGSIMGFSHTGEHICDVTPEHRPGAFAPLGNNCFLTWTFRQQEFEEKYYRTFFHNEKGETIGRVFEAKLDNATPGIIMSPLFTPAFGGYIFNPWSDDKIYLADSACGFRPLLAWKSGKYQLPFDPMSDLGRFRREGSEYITDVSACESRTRFYIRYSKDNKWQFAILEKLTGESFIPRDVDITGKGLKNDIDGGPPFWPYIDGEDGEVYINLIQCYDLLSENKWDPMNPSDKSAAERLKVLKYELTENSNPVVMIVKVR